ncbi:NAD(P)H-binding protein [bacterium]|nr:NAD(P)H-binding protein [bacterium]
MKIAITGGTGFVGRNLARELVTTGHHVVLIARGHDQTDTSILELENSTFEKASLTDLPRLSQILKGCDTVVHCAGVNRSIGKQTFFNVHVEGTQTLLESAKLAGVRKVVLMSFLQARPDCGSDYHETKWEAEELVRNSGLDFTILKCGVIYGKGDHMLNHLSHAFCTFPVFGFVGFNDQLIRPIAIEDLVQVITGSITHPKLQNQTIAVVGPEELSLRQSVRRVAGVVGKAPIMLPMPVWFHRILALVMERIMIVPMVSNAQIRMLTESLATPMNSVRFPPPELAPRIGFSVNQIQKGLPPETPFGLHDLYWGQKQSKGAER